MKKSLLLSLIPLLIMPAACQSKGEKSSSMISDSTISESVTSSSPISETSSSAEESSEQPSSSEEMVSSEELSSSEQSSQDVKEDGLIAKIAYAAHKYDSNIDRYSLAEKANIYGDTSLTRGQFFHLLRCAFENSMPEIMGARRYQGDFETHNVSQTLSKSEQRDYDFLQQHGLIAEDYDPTLASDDDFVNLMLKRIHAYYGESEVDDFAYTVNNDWLYKHDDCDGKTGGEEVFESNLIDSTVLYDNAYNLLKEAAQTPEYANLHYLVDAYENQTVCHYTLEEVFDEIYNATSIDSLFNIVIDEFGEKLMSPLFYYYTNYSTYIYAGTSYRQIRGYKIDASGIFKDLMGKDYKCQFDSFYAEKKDHINEIIDYLEGRFKVPSAITNFIKEYYPACLEMIAGDCVNYYSDSWIDGFNVISDNDDDILNVASDGVYTLDSLFDRANLHFPHYVMKYFEFYILYAIGERLTDSSFLPYLKSFLYLNYLCQMESLVFDYEEEITKANVVTMAGYNLLNYYQTTARYTQVVEATDTLFKELIHQLKENATINGWLSDSGVDALTNKANKVRHSLYGEFDGKDIDFSIIQNNFSDDFMTNLITYKKNVAYLWLDFAQKQDAGTMDFAEAMHLAMEPFTPNAFYFQYSNCIYITMGYLFSKGDDMANFSLEKLLGTFGLVMGHEITHGFDSNGCYFDGDGKTIPGSIFPAKDLTKFKEKQSDVIELYTYENMPGLNQNGKKTLSEDLADIGGLGICLGIAKSVDRTFDYQEFYRVLGQNFMSKASRKRYIDVHMTGDVHAFSAGRLNTLMMARSEFAQAFDVNKWDGMYRNPDEEIIIW